MNSLVALQIMIPVEGLHALIALERTVILLLLLTLVVMAIHLAAHRVLLILHWHAPSDQGHLASRVMYIGHDGSCHCGKIVTTIRTWMVPLRCLH